MFGGDGETTQRIRTLDWSATALGPASDWSASLRSAASICMGSRFPIALYWGPSLILLYNDAWRPIAGGKHPWALGKPAREVWPEIWDTIGPMFDHVWETGDATYSEDALLPMHRHGYTEECYFNFTFTPVRGDGGRIEGVFNAVIETTFRVISARRARVLRELGEALVGVRLEDEACGRAIASLAAASRDVPFCAIYLNEPHEPSARLVTAAHTEACPAAWPARFACRDGAAPWPLAEAADGGRVVVVTDLSARFKTTFPGGAWPEPAEAAMVVPLKVAGTVAGALILGVNPRRAVDEETLDFAERAGALLAASLGQCRAYAEERRRAEALAELDRAKTTFFSNVSHELRTPLTLVLGPLDDALRAPSGSLGGAELAAVHRNALRLLKMVNALLDFSRIQAGRADPGLQPCDLSLLTRDIASTFRSAIERGGVTFVVDCAPSRSPVAVDPVMWESIVLNLLSNAFKFTFEGQIRLSLAETADEIELAVEDTGVGIAPSEIGRIFERFHRVEGKKARTHEGSGIGLALVTELVRLHGGNVTATSEEGRGSRFVVKMPRREVAARIGAPRAVTAASRSRVDAVVEEALRWLPDDPQAGGDAALNASDQRRGDRMASRVMVVDDNADMRTYLARLLAPHWNVRTASNGEEALRMIVAERPDLVLSDVMMPGVDGFALLRALRADPATRGIPVVMLSARAGEDSKVEGLDAGADDYLIKPFAARELIARVETHLRLAGIRRRAERQREELTSLFELAPVPITVVQGAAHRFVMANAAFRRLVGDRPLLGRTLREAFPELAEHPVAAIFERVFHGGEMVRESGHTLTVRGPDGDSHDRFVSASFVPIRNLEGVVDAVMMVGIDLTEHVQMRGQLERERERLAEARHEAERANAAKDEFLAMLGHELRNPLSPILTALQLLQMRGIEARELGVIRRQVGHLSRLVDDLLDVSRITRGKIELRRAPVELSSVILRAVETASPLLEQKRQRLDLRLGADSLWVEADADRLAQVFANLLTNASKYSDAGTTVEIIAERKGDKDGAGAVEVCVRDQGIGIPASLLDKVFDVFFQQRQSLERAAGGLGLGLAIVKSLVRLHEGEVRAESAGKGQGSSFIVTLPLLPDAAIGAASQAVVKDASPFDEWPGPEDGRKILLVDDNEDAAELVAEGLRLLGHRVVLAHDGPTALSLALQMRPEIALLDIGLPVMDGYELARRLRQADGEGHLRLVAMTGYGQESDRVRAREAGFDVHLVKPVTLEALAAVVVG